MNARRQFLLGGAAGLLLVSAASHSKWWPLSKKDKEIDETNLTKILWEDLIPDDFVQPENPFATMEQAEVDRLMDGSDESNAELERLQEAFNYAPVVEALDGKRVKLPAYITPLEFDGSTKIKEFLLVPYVGACMHTPPPPANQVVHAVSPKSIEMKSIYDPVWAFGTIYAETVKSGMAESGYRLDVEAIRPYLGSE